MRRGHKEPKCKPKIMLDTRPLIKLFSIEEGWECVQKGLLEVEEGRIDASISVVMLSEVYYKHTIDGTPELARERVETLRRSIYLKKICMGGGGCNGRRVKGQV